MAKQDARDFATGASALGATGLITPEPTTTAAGAGALIGQGLSFMGMGLWDAFASVEPDEGYDLIANVEPVRFQPVEGKGRLFACVNKILTSGGDMIDSARLLTKSMRKLKGALKDCDVKNSILQYRTVEALINRSEADKYMFSVNFDELAGLYTSQVPEQDDLKITKEEILCFKDDLLKTGKLPDFEEKILQEAKITNEERGLMMEEVRLATLAAIPDSITLGGVLQGMGRSLRKIRIRELAPNLLDIEDVIGDILESSPGPTFPPVPDTDK